MNKISKKAAFSRTASFPFVPSPPLHLGSPPHGDSVRLRRMGGVYQDPPQYLHLIYIGLDGSGIVGHHLQTNIQSGNVGLEEDNLIRLARNGSPAPYDFGTMQFTKRSYLTIVLDEPGWEFYYPDPTKIQPDDHELHDPILFLPRKSIIEWNADTSKWEKDSRSFVMNQAFYNSEPLVKNVDGVVANAVRCINFRTRTDSGEFPADDVVMDYCFNIVLRVPISATNPQRKVTLIIDPDGQNLGPYP
jgi:hypothetical protein